MGALEWWRRLARLGGGARRGEAVHRTADAQAPTVQDVGVNHRRADIRVAEELLDGADVVAGFEEMGRERVAEGVTGDSAGDADGERTVVDGALDRALVVMMPVLVAGGMVPV